MKLQKIFQKLLLFSLLGVVWFSFSSSALAYTSPADQCRIDAQNEYTAKLASGKLTTEQMKQFEQDRDVKLQECNKISTMTNLNGSLSGQAPVDDTIVPFETPKKQSLADLLGKSAQIILAVITSGAVIMIVIGGIILITSNGNESQAGKGKKTIFYAIVGLVLGAGAWAIISFLQNALN